MYTQNLWNVVNKRYLIKKLILKNAKTKHKKTNPPHKKNENFLSLLSNNSSAAKPNATKVLPRTPHHFISTNFSHKALKPKQLGA